MGVESFWEYSCDICKKVERMQANALPPKWGRWQRKDEFGNWANDNCDRTGIA